MNPRSADSAVRATLVETAARILAAEGPHALTTRRLATEVGTSTMAVYTHFGSMDELRRTIRREGFARLAAELDANAMSEDPPADLAAAGDTYFASGLGDPEMYRAMFIDRPADDDEDAGDAVFQRLVGAVRRCVEAGRFHQVEPLTSLGWAAELWTMQHGMVSLALTGMLPAEQIRSLLADMTYRLFVGYGDDPESAKRSVGQRSRIR